MSSSELAPAGASRGVVTIERDGIAVQVDVSYMRSWPGIVRAADMQSERLGDTERMLAMVDYYRHACPNIDEVDEAMRAASDDDVTANDVMVLVSQAVAEATPKN